MDDAHARHSLRQALTALRPSDGRLVVTRGDDEVGIAALKKAVALSYGSPNFEGYLGHAYALAGQRDEAQRILACLLDLHERRYVKPIDVALIYAALGDADRALWWLQEGYRVRDGNMVLLASSPMWDPLRVDPRFEDLLRRTNFPQHRCSSADPLATTTTPRRGASRHQPA